MKQQLDQIWKQTLDALEKATKVSDLEAIRISILGKKGELTALLKQMGKLSADERPRMGQMANTVRSNIEQALDKKKTELEALALENRLKSETVDVTIPGDPAVLGHKHPMSIVLDEAKDIFIGMGFQIAEGPEVELSTYDFDRLNIPEGHSS